MADVSLWGKTVLGSELDDEAQANAAAQVKDYSVGPEQLRHLEEYGTHEEQAERKRNDGAAEYIAQGDPTFDEFNQAEIVRDSARSKDWDVARDVLDVEIEGRSAQLRSYEYNDVKIEWSDSLPAILAGHTKDVFIDAPISATVDFAAETLLAFTDLFRFVLPLDTLYQGFKRQITDKSFSIKSFELGMGTAELNAEAGREQIRGIAESLSPDIDNPVAQLEREMIKFVEGFIPAAKLVNTLNYVQKGVKLSAATRSLYAAEAAAITASIIYNPEHPNLANIVQMSAGEGGFPDISNGLAEFLSTRPGDPQSYNRLKNALSEFIIGPIADGFMASIRAFKNAAWAQHLNSRYAKEVSAKGEVKVTADVDEVAVAVERSKVDKELRDLGPEGEKRADEIAATEGKLDDTGPARTEAKPDDAPAAATEVERPTLTHDSIREDFQNAISPELRQRLIETVRDGDYIQGDMGWFNNNNFDLGSIESREQLLAVFSAIESIMAETAKKTGVIKRQTWEQTQEYAKAIGFNAEQTHQLHADLTDNHGLSARLHATHQTMLANGKRMLTLMEVARKTGDHVDQTAANRAIELQAAIMLETKGATSEVARALNSMKITKAASSESFEELASAAREFGVRSELITKLLSQGDGSLSALNAAADKATRATIWEMIAEVAINGMLWNPATHGVNLSANTAMLALTPWERFMAATVGYGRVSLGIGTKDRHLVRAVGRSLKAQLMGMDDTWRMTLKAAKEGVPQTDVRQKIDIAARPRLSANSLHIDPSGQIGKFVDGYLAPTIRGSTRLLTIEDELFKSTLVRGEIAALAYENAMKHADDAGLSGVEHAAFVKNRQQFLLDNPTVAMEREAIDVARRGVFQESAQTKGGPVMERLINIHPFVKLLIAPYYRTPTNVLRQTFVDRVPLMNLFVKKNRDALRAGGREGDMVIARSITGTLALYAGYNMVSKFVGPDGYFEIIGKRPHDLTGRFDNVKDYSFRMGETWYRYNRFDPFGSWLAFAADSYAIFNSRYDPSDPDADKNIADFVIAGTSALMRNVMDKVWLRSISQLMRTIEAMDVQSPARARLSMERLFADQIIKVVPFSAGLRAMTKQIDPVMREAWTVADRILAILPGLSDGLSPLRDELGREMTNLQGMNFLINPFAAGPESKDPMDQELARLDFSWPRLSMSIESGHIVLNAVQYSRFKFIIGQEAPHPGVPNLVESLGSLMESDSYKQMGDMDRIDAINGYRDAYRQIAEEKLKAEYPDLERRSRDIFVIESEERLGRQLDWLRDLLDDPDHPLRVNK